MWFHEKGLKQHLLAWVAPIVGISLYVLPAASVAFGPNAEILGLAIIPEGYTVALMAGISLIGICVFLGSRLCLDKPHRDNDEKVHRPESGIPIRSDEISLLATEYRNLSEEARYRDKLIIRTNYFTLALIGLFASIYIRIPLDARPLLVAAGTAIAFVFTLAIRKYKGARDEIRDRQSEIESMAGVSRYLQTATILRTRDRSQLGKLSLSGIISLFHVLLVIVIVGLYWWTLAVILSPPSPVVSPPG